jgi:flagellar basal body-associated protein FliL
MKTKFIIIIAIAVVSILAVVTNSYMDKKQETAEAKKSVDKMWGN